LVEGRSDKRIFEYLRHDLGLTDQDFDIDTAEDLIQSDGILGNREKVEELCCGVVPPTQGVLADGAASYLDKLVGFVDREFREFDLVPVLRDGLNTHKEFPRLVWSRGHSIENYFFDYAKLRDAFMVLSSATSHEALRQFSELFDSTLCLACALGLVGQELNMLGKIRASVDSRVVRVTNSSVCIDQTAWLSLLEKNYGINASSSSVLLEKLRVWTERVEASQKQVVRWACDGHLGFSLLWIVYDLCLCRAGQSTPIQAEERVKCNLCARLWAMNIKRPQSKEEYPLSVFTLMGFETS
jgi:hypothetical protein